jgi:hypothetical protein
MTTPREKKIRDEARLAADRENLQRATIVMTTDEIAALWAKVCLKEGAGSNDAEALREALEWRLVDRALEGGPTA